MIKMLKFGTSSNNQESHLLPVDIYYAFSMYLKPETGLSRTISNRRSEAPSGLFLPFPVKTAPKFFRCCLCQFFPLREYAAGQAWS
jgi:hypothetical protein